VRCDPIMDDPSWRVASLRSPIQLKGRAANTMDAASVKRPIMPLKESVDCREDRVLASPDLPLAESYA
jgi:hypothetical protein